jgi:predicted dehydrogenase
MASRLRLGVIGLGRRWPRYRRALAALAGELRVAAVHDDSPGRAQREARELGGEAVGGVVELVERPDVEAVLVAAPGWHGLWPAERAAAAGKPVLCAVSPAEDEGHADAARALVGDAPVHVALWPALTLVRESLAERCEESLGRPLLVQASWLRRGEEGLEDALSSPAALALVRACADLFGSDPVSVAAQEAAGREGFASLVLEFEQGLVAQLTLWGGPAARGGCGLRVEAEGGSAWAELPRRLGWQDADGRHSHELPSGLAEVLVVDRFLDAAREGAAPACGLAEACAALDWLRAARRSRDEGRRVELG